MSDSNNQTGSCHTASKAAVSSELESYSALQLLIESVTGHGICMLHLNGAVTSWNTGAEQITGYSAAEMAGQNISRLFTQEDRAQGQPSNLFARVRDKGHAQSESWRVRKDGSRFWASEGLDAIRDES